MTTGLLLRTVWKGLGIAPSSPEPWFHAPWASLPSCRPFVADAFRGRRVNPLARVHERARASHAFASRLDSRFLLAFVCLRHDSRHVSTKGRPRGQERDAVPAGGAGGGHREREGRGPPVLRPWPAALLRGRVSLSGCLGLVLHQQIAPQRLGPPSDMSFRQQLASCSDMAGGHLSRERLGRGRRRRWSPRGPFLPHGGFPGSRSSVGPLTPVDGRASEGSLQRRGVAPRLPPRVAVWGSDRPLWAGTTLHADPRRSLLRAEQS